MKRRSLTHPFRILLAALGVPGLAHALAPGHAGAQIVLEDPERTLRIEMGGWIQPRYEFAWNQPDEDLSSFYLRRVRLDFNGHIFTPRFTFRLQPEFSHGGDLRDAYFDYEFSDVLAVTFGKYSIPFEWRVSPRRDPFTERDLATSRFGSPSRDVGVMLHGMLPRRRLEYALGLFDGNAGRTRPSNSSGHMLSGRLGYALAGEIPREETDPQRLAEGNFVLGLGLEAANRNELRDWSLGRSLAGERRGDWGTVVLDGLFQRRGFSIIAKHFRRSILPADPAVDAYDGFASVLIAAYTVQPGVEVVGRGSTLQWDNADPDTRETEWAVALNAYHRGHDLKSRVHYGYWTTHGPGLLRSERVLVAELSLQF